VKSEQSYQNPAMTTKEQLLQELEQTPEDLIAATLNFLRSAKAQQAIALSESPATNPLLALLAEFDEFAANIPPMNCLTCPRMVLSSTTITSTARPNTAHIISDHVAFSHGSL
jgi:hypothetical protein